jgi:phosphoglycolate phosphatase
MPAPSVGGDPQKRSIRAFTGIIETYRRTVANGERLFGHWMSIKSAHIELYVFDLDGTLVNSLRDIAESLNECLELLGLPQRPVDDYRFMVGEGLPVLCRKAIGATHPQYVERLIELARARYRTRCLKHTRPYAGLVELTERLRARGAKLAVLSNKPHDMTVSITRHLFGHDLFDAISGYVVELLRKPNPEALWRICDPLHIRAAQTCLIGDTRIDIETARRAGARSIGVTWGFRPRDELAAAGADLIVDEPAEIG